jgi:hypothetical protein
MFNAVRVVGVLLFLFVLSISVAPLSAQSDLRVESFGPQSDFAELTFTINPGDESVLFHARAASSSDNVIIVEIVGPNGTLYIEDEDTGEITSEMFPDLLISPREVAAYLPPAPQFSLTPGQYTVVVLTENGSNISHHRKVRQRQRHPGD